MRKTTNNTLTMLRKRSFTLVCVFSVVCLLAACDASSPRLVKPSITHSVHESVKLQLPRGKTRVIDFSVNEGTNMSVDISSNGEWIVFDLLGHIYRMPSEGGDAECLTQNSGPALNYSPRFSPDGQKIAFISDRGGQENLWIMTSDGKLIRNVHPDAVARYQQPAWSADGNTLYVRRSPQIGYVSNSELWAYPARGGEGKVIRKNRNSGQPLPLIPRDVEFHAPSPSPDGKTLYYSAAYPVKNKLGPSTIYIQSLNLETGNISFFQSLFGMNSVHEDESNWRAEATSLEHAAVSEMRAPASDNNFQAEVSPNGKFMAYVRPLEGSTLSYRGHTFGPRNALFVRDLETGAERQIVAKMPLGAVRTYSAAQFGQPIYPRYAWSGDSKFIFFNEGGKIRRVDIDSLEINVIEFRARVRRELSEQVRSRTDIDDESQLIRFMRWPASSPDNSKLVFEAAGDLWIVNLPDGEPKRLTGALDGGMQFTPSWSPDGKWIAFTTWDRANGGHVWKISALGGTPMQLTQESGKYIHPVWLAGGETIAVSRRASSDLPFSYFGSKGTQREKWRVFTLPSLGGQLTDIGRIAGERRPQFDSAGNLIAELSPGVLAKFKNEANSRSSETTIRLKAAANTEYGNGALTPFAKPILSPDGHRVAYTLENKIYITFIGDRINQKGAIEIPVDGTQLDSRCIADKISEQCLTSLKGGKYPRWKDATTLEFMSGATYVVYDALTGQARYTPIHLNVRRPDNKGKIAIVNAKLITLKGSDVVASGSVIVEGRRITCLGDCDTSDAKKIVNAKGKTIIPGLVNTHDHHSLMSAEVMDVKHAAYATALAYGVTTTANLGELACSSCAMTQLIQSGKMLGPRLYFIGRSLRAFDEEVQAIQTLNQARALVDRRLNWGATYIKDYQAGSRKKRQLIAKAAQERELTLTYGHDGLNQFVGSAIDGLPGWEHRILIAPIYQDISEFMGRAGMSHSFTAISSGHPKGLKHYYRPRQNLLQSEKYRRFMPLADIQRNIADSTLTNQGRIPEKSEFSFPLIAEGAADIVRAGGWVTIGDHGDQAGIGDHWEMWGLAEAMTPLEALRAASLSGARWLGIDHETGSLEVGKLADLVILNSDPLENIHNTADIAYVMKDGVLYEGSTLAELWPVSRPSAAIDYSSTASPSAEP